jgi:peptide/nickel transport system substrate-binding protein
MGHHRSLARLITITAVLAILGAACSSGKKQASSTSGSLASKPTSASSASKPTQGGAITVGEVTPAVSLDPAFLAGDSGQYYGDEFGALYGYLMHWDPSTGNYTPGMAQSLTPNNDSTVWTLTLRPSVTFTDGTPFSAQAVVANITREMTPSHHSGSLGLLKHFVQSMSTPDDRTVVFTLTQPWTGFPYMFVQAPGAVASPSYLNRLDAGDTTATAVGAGPFRVSSFRPGEELTLVRNPAYFAGPPYLDSLKFVPIPGATATLQAFQTGQLQVAVVSDARVEQMVKNEHIPYVPISTPGSIHVVMALNNTPLNAKGGSVFSDQRLREAVALGLDPQFYNQRVYQGAATVGKGLFSPASRWYQSGTSSIPYDTAKARQLVDEVKQQTGWDGTIRYVCNNTPEAAATPVAVEAMLQPLGFKLQVNNNITNNQLITAVAVQRSYDAACWNFSLPDEPFAFMWQNYDSQSAVNYYGYGNGGMDAALDAAKAAPTVATEKTALTQVATAWNTSIPAVNLGYYDSLTIHSQSVNGLQESMNAVVLFDKAWTTG